MPKSKNLPPGTYTVKIEQVIKHRGKRKGQVSLKLKVGKRKRRIYAKI